MAGGRGVKMDAELEKIIGRVLFTDHPHIGVYLIDEENFYFVNNTLARMFGYSPEELIGKKGPLDLTHPEDQLLALENIRLRIRGEKEATRYEFQGVRKDGRIIWCESFGKKVLYREKPAILGILIDITEKKKVEEAVSSLLRFQKNMLETAAVWIEIIDENGNVIFWNRAAEKISLYSRKEVLGHKKVFEYLYPSPQYRERILKKIMDVMQKGEKLEYFESEINSRDGNKKIISWHCNPLTDEKGKTVGSILIGIDVTERKKLENELKESAEMYKTLFQNIPDGICVIKPKTFKIIDCNSSMKKMIGKKSEKIFQLSFIDLIPFDLKKSTIKFLQREKDGTYLQTEILGDGERIPVSLKYSLISYKGERIILLLIKNMKEIFRLESALKESEERFRRLVNNVPVGIYRNTPGPKGKFLMANQAIAKMFRYDSVEEFLKSPVSSLYFNPQERKKFSKELSSKGIVVRKPLMLKRRNGEIFWGAVTAQCVRDEKGRAIYFDGMIEDITELKNMEEKLFESERRLRRFCESTLEGIILCSSGKIIDANSKAYELLGYVEEELKGKRLIDFVQGEEIKLFKNILRKGKGTCSFIKKNGIIVELNIYYRKMKFSDGEKMEVFYLKSLDDNF